jgi:hypothetical protein
MSVVALVLAPFRLGQSLKFKSSPFIYTLLIYSSSYVMTYFFGANESKFMSLVRLILTTFVDFYIFFVIIKINFKKYTSIFIKSVTIFSFIFSLYAVIETIIGSNPYIDIVTSNNLYVYDTIINDIRFGFKRSQSLFSMHTTLGYLSMISCVFLLYIKRHTNYFKNKNIYIVIALCGIAVFLSGARSMIGGFAVCLLMLVDKKFLKIKYIVPVAITVVALYFGLYSFWDVLLDSFTDTSSVSGSSTDMREEQFAIATMFLDRGFWFGNGLLYTFTNVINMFPDLNGAESIWLPTMIDQGIYGVICTIIVYISAIVYTIKNKKLPLMFFVIGNIFSYTASSIPGTTYFSFLVYLVIMEMMSDNNLTLIRK